MMKRIYVLCVAIFALQLTASAQKPVIDSSVYQHWPQVGDVFVSNNGEFVGYYQLNNGEENVLSVKATRNKWMLSIRNAAEAAFSEKSDLLIFKKGADSLGIASLGRNDVNYIANIESFQIRNQKGDNYLAYLTKQPNQDLVLRNLKNSVQTIYRDVKSYSFSEDGHVLLLLKNASDKTSNVRIEWLSMPRGVAKTIYSGCCPDNFTFSKDDQQLYFLSKDKTSQKLSIYCYKTGYGQATKLNYHCVDGQDTTFDIDHIRSFNDDQKGLLIDLVKKEPLQNPSKNAVMVDVWSYTDPELKSIQLAELNPNSDFHRFQPSANYTAIVSLTDGNMTRLLGDNEFFVASSRNTLLLRQDGEGDYYNEDNWRIKAAVNWFLVTLKANTRTKLKAGSSCKLSPDGRYAIYTDEKNRDWFSIEIATGTIRNITQSKINNCKVTSTDSIFFAPMFAGWLTNDTALFYDNNDIWASDIQLPMPPVELTGGYGLKHQIIFRLMQRPFEKNIQLQGSKLLLSAFDEASKNSGFFSLDLKKPSDPQLLTMGPYLFGSGDAYGDANILPPVRARDRDCYVVVRERANESPNYFWTTDFKTFKPFSEIYPEKKYNWLMSELVTWTDFKGHISQGILYKPENFDPAKKYPVIFYYYEQHSNALNAFLTPEYSIGPLNIPEYVSNGYLVFLPDIHYEIGRAGESAYNAVVSAAQHIAKLPFVDSARMGIQGHSFGGYETYYIVAHSHIFAAAQAAEGVTDLVSDYGGLRNMTIGSQWYYEKKTQQGRIGTSFWERPDLYINGSPIYSAEKVTTPILMMDNKNDAIVPFAQGIEFFTAMRRLGKKAWLLQYDGQGHILTGNASKDFTTRMRQFFDHYLKGAPAPLWMTEGIPAKMKGTNDGLRLEPAGIVPGAGLLSPEAQLKADSLQHRKPFTITIN